MSGAFSKWLLRLAILAVVGGGGWTLYRSWSASQSRDTADTSDSHAAPTHAVDQQVRLSPQARNNLQLVAKRLEPRTFWRTVELPGVIVDRPGISDRGVVTPVTGVVTRVFAFPGDTVEPDEPLFAIRLSSESLYTSQLELFKATKEIEITRRQLQRLIDATQSGAVPRARKTELEEQAIRLEGTVHAYRQDLQSRGLTTDRIDTAAKGEFVTEVMVNSPALRATGSASESTDTKSGSEAAQVRFNFEVQSLNVELGQQVQAGHVLCHLSDHRKLFIEGRSFKEEMPLIQEAARNGWGVEVDYDVPEVGEWSPQPEKLPIHYVANTIDPDSRTFAFYLELENQWQAYTRSDVTRLIWRFRPGTRVRLRVAVEKFDEVFVVPQSAVVQEGPEAFVFRQNGNLFDRRAVHVLFEDRLHSVLGKDSDLRAGFFIAQGGAASLNRILKSQVAIGQPAGVHVHPDGTVH